MTKKYDLVIVGAGPSGAMAAKVAGDIGLKAAILERKANPAKITRGCAMMFAVEYDYFNAERVSYNEKNKKMIFPVNGFTVGYDGPRRDFYTWRFYAPDGKTRLEFGDYEAKVKKGDRLSFVYDKSRLISGLMKDAEENGVDVFSGVNVEGVERTAKGVRVTGNGETFEGAFVIGADGINSRVAQLMGFNKDRKLYGAFPKLTYYVRGLKIPESEAMITACFSKSGSVMPTSFFIVPSAYANDEYWISVSTPEELDYIAKESVYAEWFTDAKVNRVLGYIFTFRTPVTEPYKDNALLVGDAAWFAEAEIMGSLMSGWKAAHTVAVALRDNRLNRDGIVNYIDWWKKSFSEFDDYRKFFLCVLFYGRLFSAEEIKYLYGLIQEPLQTNINASRVVGIIKKALEPMMPQIRKEMPSAADKLDLLEVDNFDQLLSYLKIEAKPG
jgi:flavin-dependent dehydrogenase